MVADHVVVRFTTDSKQHADTMAAEVTDTPFCCAHIEGPVRSIHRWHGRKHTSEEWRVEIEATADAARSLVSHFEADHGDEIHNLTVTDNITHVFDGHAGPRGI